MTATMSWWPRQRALTPEERDRLLREKKAERALRQVDRLAVELKVVVDELHALARRTNGTEG